MSEDKDFHKEDVLDGKMYAVLSYLSILCIIPLIFKKQNPFVLAHSKQGLVLFIAEAGIAILSIVVPALFAPLIFIFLILSFWGMVCAVRGVMVRLPVVCDIAAKIVL